MAPEPQADRQGDMPRVHVRDDEIIEDSAMRIEGPSSANYATSSSFSDTRVMDYIRSLEERIRKMELDGGTKPADSASGTPAVPPVTAPSAAPFGPAAPHNVVASPTQGLSPAATMKVPPSAPLPTTFKPEVRWCNWEDFKNRFTPEDANYAVEVLLDSQFMSAEQRQEMSTRFAVEERNRSGGAAAFNSDLPPEPPMSMDAKGFPRTARRIERVRIQSKAVLRTLGKVSRKLGLYPLDDSTPTTYPAPFKQLIYLHPRLKDEISKLEKEKVDNAGSSSSPPAAAKPTSPVDIPTPPEDATAKDKADTEGGDTAGVEGALSALEKNKAAALSSSALAAPMSEQDMAELECYVKFMDEHIMPRFLQLRSKVVSEDCPRRIRYDDLWYLFRPDDLVYVPPPNKFGSSRFPETTQTIFRVWDVATTLPEWQVDKIAKEHQKSRGKRQQPPEEGKEEDDDKDNVANGATIKTYYLDYTGSTLCPVRTDIEIPYYEGEVDILSLSVFPLRFHENREELIRDLPEQRKLFLKYIKGHQHLAYAGWSRVKNIRGLPEERKEPLPEWLRGLPDIEDIINQKTPQFIDSEVIVDFEEAFQNRPQWRPNFMWAVHPVEITARWATDSFPIIQWSDRSRTKMVSSINELHENGSGVGLLEGNEALKESQFLTLASYINAGPKQHDTVEGEDVLLLPPRLFAYALRERKFLQVDIQYLRPIENVVDPFSSLRIDDEHKTMIQGLVHSHFATQNLQNTSGSVLPSQDLIHGKGRGVVVLLHGFPGVGKTATAEAVAQHYKKPLFAITCADLGLKADDVEDRLSEIFRLSHLWDCILLLDEADVFLSQREPNDLDRNALVSVILRILEYHKGILFLTTNRDGRLDEAVKSRVHVSLHYPPLSKDQTIEIFKLNMERLDMIETQRSERSGERKLVIFKDEIIKFAEDHYKTHNTGLGSWNGRQIRNAFQIAASLAHYNKMQYKTEEAQLNKSHFETVAKAVRNYDEFRANVKGKTDREVAKERGERDDAFEGGFVRSSWEERARHRGMYGPESRSGPQSQMYAGSSPPYYPRGM